MVGALKILEFFHLIQIVDDEDEVDAFYDRLFAPLRFMTKQFSATEKRWASLAMVSDLMLEVIEPSTEPRDSQMPLTKFRSRHGQHFHSFAWYLDPEDLVTAFRTLREAGIRVTRPGGGVFPDGDIDPGNTIFTHPKDTFGQIEFEGKSGHWATGDPRFQPGWSDDPWRKGPLGIERLSHMTTVVRELEPARRFYVDVLCAEAFHEQKSESDQSVFVLVGQDTVIELACPTDPAGPMAQDLAEHGELPHSATFRVRDLATVERHVESLGIGIASRRGNSIALDPTSCYGARWCFTDHDLPGDPRGAVAPERASVR